jgi:general secretion pathway protein D
MKRLTRVLALLLIFGSLPAVATDKAKALYKQGLDAEMRQDYETAYNFYHQAYDLKPSDLQYRASFERIRFFASASHVHKGQLLEKSGKLQEALTEFEQAMAIDP